MASANLAINNHTTTDVNDPGSDRIDLRRALPLEIQEHIISSGPWDPERDRVAFLCLCALVCKDWVARSRSALALKVTSGRRLQSFLELMKHANMTLAYSVKRLHTWESEDFAVVGPYFLSVEELSITVRRVPGVADSLQQSFSMPSVRIMSLIGSIFESMADLLTFIACFPSIHSLDISYLQALDELNDHFFQTMGVPVRGLTALTVEICKEWDIRFLGSILALLPEIQSLQLQVLHYRPSVVAEWVSRNHLTPRAEIEVSLVLYCSKRDRHAYSIDEDCANFFSMFDSLDLAEPYLEHLEKIIPLWISYSSTRLKRITFTRLDSEFHHSGLDGVDWMALSSSLGAAKQLKDVRFVKWCDRDRIPAHIKALLVLAHPHFSLSVQMSEYPDSVEQLVV